MFFPLPDSGGHPILRVLARAAVPLVAAAGGRGNVPTRGAPAARALLHTALRALEGGEIVVIDRGRRHQFRGRYADRYGRADLQATIAVHDERFYPAVVRKGSSGLGEAYRRGWFDTDDLPALLRLLARLLRRADPARLRLRRLTAPVTDPWRRLRRPDRTRDREHIAAHYDLGNPFFELFLDETLTYSSARFAHPGSPLVDASITKIDDLCQALALRPGMRVVELGTGWGTFAIHAARKYGVDVVTTTLSNEQHRAALPRVADAGLSDRIDVRLDHYRDLDGTFDALVAIEMIEAVDWRELDDFFAQCARLVEPRGVIGLQAIVTAAHREPLTRVGADFIKSHVFPGGSLPSVPSMLDAVARGTDLTPVDLRDFGLHYAETLRRWRANLAVRRADARTLGLDEAVLRLWDFYLCYCEAGFEERVVQLVLERPGRSPSLLGDRTGWPRAGR